MNDSIFLNALFIFNYFFQYADCDSIQNQLILTTH